MIKIGKLRLVVVVVVVVVVAAPDFRGEENRNDESRLCYAKGVFLSLSMDT